jgi:phospholipase/carboxylesterase
MNPPLPRDLRLTRRAILASAPISLTAVLRMCSNANGSEEELSQKKGDKSHSIGRLSARPKAVEGTPSTGSQRLGLGGSRDGVLYTPASYKVDQPAPLFVLLHGAGGKSERIVSMLQPLADRTGALLLAPDSRRQTWDIILEKYGPDVEFLDRALEQTFSRYAVNPQRLAIGGFSDGASYGLSLGTANGDLFTHVIAFSPGFVAGSRHEGKPRIFISHGSQDRILPINDCSRKIVPRLQRAGYEVRYREFDGPHTVPPEIAREAVDWFVT